MLIAQSAKASTGQRDAAKSVHWIAYGAAAGLLTLVIPNTVALLIGTAVVIVTQLHPLRQDADASAWTAERLG